MKSKKFLSNIFAIDTSTAKLSAALYANNKLYTLNEISSDHSEKLTVALDILLKKSKTKLQDLNVVGVNIGPGSFTGLRVGLCFVRVLADVLKINKIVTTNSFLMLLYEARQYILNKKNRCKVVTLFPSVKNEFYYCKFAVSEKNFKKIGAENYAKTEEIKKYFYGKKDYYFVLPDEMLEFKNTFKKIVQVKFSSESIIKMLLDRATSFFNFTQPKKLKPFYLRHTYY